MKILFIFLVVLVPVLTAQTVLFSDDFSDGNADGWFVLMPEGTYSVNDSLRYQISYTGVEDVDPTVVRGDSAGIYMTTSNYSVLLEGVGHSPSDYIGVFVRGTFSHTGYTFFLRYTYNDICILRHDGEGQWTFIALESYAVSCDEFYWMRFECDEDNLRAKVWQGTTGDEPAEWLITAIDDTYSNCGFMGFLTGRYTSSPGDSDAELDNVVVTGLPLSFDQSTWAGIKSIF
ncbi:hypothetical protein DRQ25_11635 [Candidatus Fermentibacteria bacterium]|nr:MAG: hypothetical protein DRQ25_11635 [Candidatus Fermentibacteria bacterium]